MQLQYPHPLQQLPLKQNSLTAKSMQQHPMNMNTQNLPPAQGSLQDLKLENQNLKQKVDYLSGLFDTSPCFESQKWIDIKLFLKKNYLQQSELLDEIYQLKLQSKENQNPNPNIQQVPQNQQQNSENANQSFYLSKIKELEEKNEANIKEIQTLKEGNKKLREDVSKKDFFREYDFMVKEVDGLRKQNGTLSEQIKKLKGQQ